MGYVFAVQETPAVDVEGTEDRFPVHRIYYVGKNYAKYIREMGANPELPYPLVTENLHHEIELVVAIGKNGTNISEAEVLDYVFVYEVGLDLSRRDLCREMLKKG